MRGDTVHLPKMVSVSACLEVVPELYFLHSSAYPTQRCDLLTVRTWFPAAVCVGISVMIAIFERSIQRDRVNAFLMSSGQAQLPEVQNLNLQTLCVHEIKFSVIGWRGNHLEAIHELFSCQRLSNKLIKPTLCTFHHVRICTQDITVEFSQLNTIGNSFASSTKHSLKEGLS
jgi:hypothetical protein